MENALGAENLLAPFRRTRYDHDLMNLYIIGC